MPQYTFGVYGVNRVRNSLRALVSAHKKILDPTVRQWAQSIRAKLKSTPYPAPPPNSTYIRTGRLANSWKASRRPRVAHYIIENTAPYSSYVVGDVAGELKQAWMHVGRWWRARDIIEAELPKLRADIEEALDNI